MLKNISALGILAVLLLACSSSDDVAGRSQLGAGFDRAFAQDPNDTPLEVENLGLKLTPRRDPFNP